MNRSVLIAWDAAYRAAAKSTRSTAAQIRALVDGIKVATGCESCGFTDYACALQFDHIDPATKYRTKSGNIVHPADMIKGGRYSLTTILAEIAKCRILCANCHAIYTHTEQRKGL